ncbi:response regulator transcription factor [Thiospirochaeta perfilievii]|uniref:Phosphate regulon transcriptional regulatory protein PhoB n=2 Tax=Thiospirochaeta perfilievii TaxID=252967 RepID=A0A5C1QEG4_9SPIO|nr:response regulator transcription factor [Thiospirochaeta perfilievii]
MMDMSKKILVVDDEEKIRKMICDYLEAVGFLTIPAKDGVDAVSIFVKEQPDLIIMDVMMPGIDGIDSTRRIRERSNVPIIMLTAKAEEGDKLLGLEMGADDYITKPFSLKELAARVRALLRRVSFSKVEEEEVKIDPIIKIKDLKIDTEKMTVYRKSEKLSLTSVQFTILKNLMLSPGRVFTRIQILNSFQEDVFEGYERTIDVHIKNIRKVIEREPSKPKFIETVWGVGYKFAEEEDSV